MSTSSSSHVSPSPGASRIFMAALACMTLGLAPLSPEPHIVGKVRWVLGGAVGMGPMDWADLIMHGAPWVALVVMLVVDGPRLLRPKPSRPRETG